MNQLVLQVDGMKCGGCAARLQKTLEAVDGIAWAQVNLPLQQVALAFDTRTNEEALRDVIAKAGFATAC